MPKFGNPLQSGSLGSLIMGIGLVLVMGYIYLTSAERSSLFLVFFVLGVLSTIGSYFQYRKLNQKDGRGN
ncbi:MAG: hypothetical protein O3B41_09665 [Bacteroidetes bacterium]|nr:hypothetical protein [Bacteroidota bacterium]